MTWLFFVVATVAGAALGLQGLVNSGRARHLHGAFAAVFASFVLGLAACSAPSAWSASPSRCRGSASRPRSA